MSELTLFDWAILATIVVFIPPVAFTFHIFIWWVLGALKGKRRGMQIPED